MPHDIEQFADGDAAFFSARELPWHALGVVTDETLTAERALEVAHLGGWNVRKEQLHIDNGTPITGKYATVRDNPKTGNVEPLGVVGNHYEVVQNEDAFAFLDALVDAAGGAHYETAGSLRSGNRVFMTMRVPREMKVGGKDAVAAYLLCTNSHDGTSPFTVAVTPVRVVCSNTLNYGLKAAEMRWSVRHTSSNKGRVQEARETLDLTWEALDAFESEAQRLIDKSITDAKFDRLVERIFPLAKDAGKRKTNAVEQTRAEVRALYHSAPTQADVKGTAWGAAQSFVEWADWARDVRPGEQSESVARATQIIDGRAVPLFKRKVMDAALAIK